MRAGDSSLHSSGLKQRVGRCPWDAVNLHNCGKGPPDQQSFPQHAAPRASEKEGKAQAQSRWSCAVSYSRSCIRVSEEEQRDPISLPVAPSLTGELTPPRAPPTWGSCKAGWQDVRP